ncbi:MAG: IS66 family transposase [Mojavia pulchra JT2-VF2]|jgi:predicted RecB family nuclease|uniref:IS66 family transposase n=1 Tax=Mojavia pulchra JT2-VF2 TaxID=287848 RepID=A0A951Q500_9NOST|nr:IS66 family transposase [Mojavia pulchra JT2-VF2]
MAKVITSQILVAYAQCPYKAFLLMCGEPSRELHEHEQIVEQQKSHVKTKYIDVLKKDNPNVQLYQQNNLEHGIDYLINAQLSIGTLLATCCFLKKVNDKSSLGNFSYEPNIFIGSYQINETAKLELFFIGYVLAQIQGCLPNVGHIITVDGKSHRIRFKNIEKNLIPILEPLQRWVTSLSSEPPPIILNKHCPICQFKMLCRAKALQDNHLSLLNGITPKAIRRYEKKGIFTVKQLSYLFKPHKRKKGKRNKFDNTHKLELQALAIRTGKIYLQYLPELCRQSTELFLDIEGVPDQDLYYLIGLLVCQPDTIKLYSFWANTAEEERQIWQQMLAVINQYSNAPIYHYGSYESRAISKLAKRYKTSSDTIIQRLVNVNSYIHGNIYFPVYSNSLKEIGSFIGATWTSPVASGLQSLVWQHYWQETSDTQYKDCLLTYNAEDCHALKLLVDELSKIKTSADTLSEVEFSEEHQKQKNQIVTEISSQFETMLNFAHMDYDKKKINFRQDTNQSIHEEVKKKRGVKKGYEGQRRINPKATKIIEVPAAVNCPICNNISLKITTRLATRLIINLVLTKNGVKKTIIKYLGNKGYCPQCCKFYNPPVISKYGHSQLYGHGFKAWLIYHRVAMRLPYESISEMMQEQFGEKILAGSIVTFIKDFAQYYSETEKFIIQSLLKSPSIHVDETTINIKGFNWYGWVFTNEEYVVFKLSETREATIVHELLLGYTGILISDFYAGYDSVQCRQQKCWVHLIRDLNDDLRETPFDTEYEMFVLEVKNLIIPIMEAIQKYGLKKRVLEKFKKEVDKFYQLFITDKWYRSDLVIKYQKRFKRYRDSLFTFLEEDKILWHNNVAERAIRHLAIQRDISTPFHESSTRNYLLLLSIQQTCRFQGKSFFKFLFSEETDIKKFKAVKH